MPHEAPSCPRCGRTIICDNCGPIEGGPAAFRPGDAPPHVSPGDPTPDWAWVCDACLKADAARPPP